MDVNQQAGHMQGSDSKSTEDGGMDIGALIMKFVRHWKWFVLSFVLLLLIGFYQLNFKRPQFEAITTIEIKNDAGNDPRMGIFSQMGIMAGSKDKVADEMEIIRSKSLIAEVIKSLNLNVKYFTNKNFLSSFLDDNLGFSSEFYENERYENPPFVLNFYENDSIVEKIETDFLITVNSADNYTFSDLLRTQIKTHSFGDKITTNFGDIVITPNVDLKLDSLIGKSVHVNISPLKKLVDSYGYNLEVNRKSEFSHILGISISDGSRQKAVDFLNQLVEKYNNRAVELKRALTESTSNFVTERLEKIEAELAQEDSRTEQLKSSFQMSDNASKTGLDMQSNQITEQEIIDARTALGNTQYLNDYISTTTNEDLINLDMAAGSLDNSTKAQANTYNEIMMQKKRLLKNVTEKSPQITRLNSQLNELKSNIKQGLNNITIAQERSITSLEERKSILSGRLYAAPKQESKVRDAERTRSIKESLFLLLLEKREETAVTLGVTDPNARIIDYAETMPFPKSPKKKMFLLIFGFLGLIIPAVVIYVLDMLDTKIHTREEVEKQLSNVPIIGDIPKLETKERFLMKKSDYSSVAEAFRILRTNLKFMLPKPKNGKGQVVFITSTIAHEGKSLVSSNLSAALAFADKKTLLLGLDIRAPKIEKYLGARSVVGVTNYIINSELTPEDITISAPDIEHLDIMSSGELAPNPSELLMNDRVSELFDYARENYDYIIVDTAAFSMVTDTLLLSGFADAFIYVIRTNFLDKRMLKYVKSIYRDKRLPNMSLLVNGIDAKKGYGYGYGYGSEFEKAKRKWWQLG